MKLISSSVFCLLAGKAAANIGSLVHEDENLNTVVTDHSLIPRIKAWLVGIVEEKLKSSDTALPAPINKAVESLLTDLKAIPDDQNLTISGELLESYSDSDFRFTTCEDCIVFFNFEDISNYGCWCVFNDEATSFTNTKGGLAVDLIDSQCKSLQLCYRCARLDSIKENDPEECIAQTEPYEFDIHFNFFTPENLIDMNCFDEEQSCKWRACMCDSKFVEDVFNTDSFNTAFDAQWKHENFDFEGSCYALGQNAIKDCCGPYPDRRPYNAAPDHHIKCCNNLRLYNNDVSQCCSDGTTVRFGESCL